MPNSKAKSIVEELIEKKKLDVSLLNEEDSPCVVQDWLSSGCVVLDWMLGGGFPLGRITEIYGDESTGKSLIAAQAIAVAQQEDIISMMIDTESAVSLPIMKAVGVNIDELIYSAPDTVEEVFEIIDSAIESKDKKYPDSKMIIVWDTIAATSVALEMDSPYGKSLMGRHALMISQSLRKIARKLSHSHIYALFLNQTRQKIGVMYGDPETTTGGKAVRFYASVRLRLHLSQKLKQGKKIVAVETSASVVKNKVAVPFRNAKLPIFFGHGIDDALATYYWLEDNEFVSKGVHKVLKIGNEEVRFTKKSFPDVYDKHFDDISNLVLEFDNIDVNADIEGEANEDEE